MAVRITQAGVALTVGIIVVTGLIIGGLFAVKNSGEQARREDAIKIAEQNLQDQSNDGVALNDSDKESNANNSSNESTTSGEGATNSDDTTTESTNSTNTSNQTANVLPQTGPAGQLASLVVVALLTFSVVSYITSYRQSIDI